MTRSYFPGKPRLRPQVGHSQRIRTANLVQMQLDQAAVAPMATKISQSSNGTTQQMEPVFHGFTDSEIRATKKQVQRQKPIRPDGHFRVSSVVEANAEIRHHVPTVNPVQVEGVVVSGKPLIRPSKLGALGQGMMKQTTTISHNAAQTTNKAHEGQTPEHIQRLVTLKKCEGFKARRRACNRPECAPTPSASGSSKPLLLRQSKLVLNDSLLQRIRSNPIQQADLTMKKKSSCTTAASVSPILSSKVKNNNSPGSSAIKSGTNNRLPGSITCGICGAVRYYSFILQAKKFGIFSCEPCRKFISKCIRRVNLCQEKELFCCLKGSGECGVPPVLRRPTTITSVRRIKADKDVRCQACWLKLCLLSYNLEASLYDQLRSCLPPVLRHQIPDSAQRCSNKLLSVGKTDAHELQRQQVPFSRPLFEGFGSNKSDTTLNEVLLETVSKKYPSSYSGAKNPCADSQIPCRDTHVVQERLPNGWTKKAVKKVLGGRLEQSKWELFLITPDQKVLRSINELKYYIAKSGAVVDANIVNFSLPKKTAKVDKVLGRQSNETSSKDTEENYSSASTLPLEQDHITQTFKQGSNNQDQFDRTSNRKQLVDSVIQSSQKTCVENVKPIKQASKLTGIGVGTFSIDEVTAKSMTSGRFMSRNKMRRCGVCSGCNAVNCRQCDACLDMLKYGGKGLLKQACIQRRCKNPLMPGTTLSSTPLLSPPLTDLKMNSISLDSPSTLTAECSSGQIDRGDSASPSSSKENVANQSDNDCEEEEELTLNATPSMTIKTALTNDALPMSKTQPLKPRLSYSCLIAMALQNSPEQRATLSEIYSFIMDKFPYYKSIGKAGWQNSIRHNLSIHKAFIRTTRSSDVNKYKTATGVWTIHPHYSAGLFRKVSRVTGQMTHVTSPSKLNDSFWVPDQDAFFDCNSPSSNTDHALLLSPDKRQIQSKVTMLTSVDDSVEVKAAQKIASMGHICPPEADMLWSTSGGYAVIMPGVQTSASLEWLCLMCGAAGKEDMTFCLICCEPYHSFCIDQDCHKPHEAGSLWICPKCSLCQTCGQRLSSNDSALKCHQCHRSFHQNCLNSSQKDLVHKATVWKCGTCLRCVSCNKADVTNFIRHDEDSQLLPYCSQCSLQKKKGSFCPLCLGCYDDNDFESRMVECASCRAWIHAKCEDMTVEKYQILSYLPDTIEYVCKKCHNHEDGLPKWKTAVEHEFNSSLKAIHDKLISNAVILSKCASIESSPTQVTKPLTAHDSIKSISDLSSDSTLRRISARIEHGLYSTLYEFHKDFCSLFKHLNITEQETIKLSYYDVLSQVLSWFDYNHAKEYFETGSPSQDVVVYHPPSLDHIYSTKGALKSRSDEVNNCTSYWKSKYQTTEDARQCSLCNFRGDDEIDRAGRLLYFKQNCWVHVNCALWSSEVYEDADGCLQNLQQALNRGARVNCCLCGAKGATVSCCKDTCKVNYHFICALKHGASCKEDKTVYCPKHKTWESFKAKEDCKDFRVYRTVHFKNLKKMKSSDLVDFSSLRIHIGSLQIDSLGYIHPSASDFQNVLVPVGFSGSRFFWSTRDPFRLARYRFKTRLSIPLIEKDRSLSPSYIGEVVINHEVDDMEKAKNKLKTFDDYVKRRRWREDKRRPLIRKILSPMEISSIWNHLTYAHLHPERAKPVSIIDPKKIGPMNPPYLGIATSRTVNQPQVPSSNEDCIPTLANDPNHFLGESTPKKLNKAVVAAASSCCAVDEILDAISTSLDDKDHELISSLLSAENLDEVDFCGEDVQVMQTWFDQINRQKFSEVAVQCNLPFDKTNMDMDEEQPKLDPCVSAEEIDDKDEDIDGDEDILSYVTENIEQMSQAKPVVGDLSRVELSSIITNFLQSSTNFHLNNKENVEESSSQYRSVTKRISQLDGADDSDEALQPPTSKMQKRDASNFQSPRKDFSIAGLLSAEAQMAAAVAAAAAASRESADYHRNGRQQLLLPKPSQPAPPPSNPAAPQPVYIQHLTTPTMAPSFYPNAARTLQYFTNVNSFQQISNFQHTFPAFSHTALQLHPNPQVSFQGYLPSHQSFNFITPPTYYVNPPPPPPPQANYINFLAPQPPPTQYVFNSPLTTSSPSMPFGPVTTSVSANCKPTTSASSSASRKKIAKVYPQPSSSRLDPIKALSVMASHPVSMASSSSSSRSSKSHSQSVSKEIDVITISEQQHQQPKQRKSLDKQRSVGTQARLEGPLKILTPRPWTGSKDSQVTLPQGSGTMSSGVSVNSSANSSLAGSRPNSALSMDSLLRPQTKPNRSASSSPEWVQMRTEDLAISKEKSNSHSIQFVLEKNGGDDSYKITQVAIEEGSENSPGVTAEQALNELNKIRARVPSRKARIQRVSMVVPLDDAGRQIHSQEHFVNELVVSSDSKTNSDGINEPIKDEEEGKEPFIIYEMTSEDGFRAESPCINELWQKVLEAVDEARHRHGLHCPSGNSHFWGSQGLQMLGLTHSALTFLLEQLPGAKSTEKYMFKHFKVKEEEPEVPLKINETGCARSEPYTGRSPLDMFSWLNSRHRKIPLPVAAADGFVPTAIQGTSTGSCVQNEASDSDVQLSVSRRATSMDLPMAMRYRHLARSAKEAVGVFKSAIHGRGLYCKREIQPGEMVIEYAGEEIRSVLTDKREKYYESRGIGCYMFKVDEDTVVDATMKGNAARFINHSCDPNCYSKIVDILGKKHIIIFALRRIVPGEELTYDYKFPFEDVKIPCRCGAKKCRKYMN